MSEESDVQKGMVEFLQRAKDSLPVVPSAPPFEVKVDIQSTPSVPFKNDQSVSVPEDDTKNVGGPPPVGITSVTPNVVSSGGGTTVTISGSNFVNGATVKIGGISATGVTFVNPSTLTCVTPADGLGWLTVEVTNPSGQSSSLANAINYVNWPDNVLLEGPLVQRADTYGGYAYPYKLTIRIGSVPFAPPPGVDVYAFFSLPPYNGLGKVNVGVVDIVNTANDGTYLLFNNATGPSKNITIRAEADPVHTNGYVEIAGTLQHASQNGVAPSVPTYGDPSFQPRCFRIHTDINGPYPPTVPTAEYFSWDRGPGNTKNNPFGWLSGDFNNLAITRRLGTGAVNTGFSGTAVLTWARIGSNIGDLSVGAWTSITVHFTSGVATTSVYASYSYFDVGNTQGYGYFRITATDGTIVGSTPTCACLNHL